MLDGGHWESGGPDPHKSLTTPLTPSLHNSTGWMPIVELTNFTVSGDNTPQKTKTQPLKGCISSHLPLIKKKKKLEDRGRRLQQQQSQDLCWALMERVSSGWVLGTHDPSTTPMTQFLSNRNLQYAGICLEGLLQDWGTLQVTERGTRNLKVILALSKTPLSVTLHDSIWKSNRLFASSQLQVCKRYHGFAKVIEHSTLPKLLWAYTYSILHTKLFDLTNHEEENLLLMSLNHEKIN